MDEEKNAEINIAIFASGKGSNAQKIIDHFNDSVERKNGKVVLVISNNTDAGVLKIAEKENIPSLIFDKTKFYEDSYVSEIKKHNIGLIVLAGFLWKIPVDLIKAYPNKIINIHPALLPKFGGKKMYGHFVHEAVLKAGEKESGITIHYVDEIYDHGKIIFQAKTSIEENETPESLAEKIHVLEHENYSAIIEKLITALKHL